MSKLLTQDEIDALLQSARKLGASRETGATETARRATRYDFKKQSDYISKDHMRSLQMMHEHFASSFSASLTVMMRAVCNASLQSIKSQPYSEFLHSMLDPTVIITASMKPLEGLAVLEFNHALVFPVIDLILGGPGVMPNLARPITEIEWHIFESIIRMALDDLQQAWVPLLPDITLEINSHETRPHMVHVIPHHDTVLTFTFAVQVAESTGTLHLCIQTVALKPFIERFEFSWQDRRKTRSPESIGRLVSVLKGAIATVSAEIRGTHLSIDELVQLQPGDVLRFDHRLSQPVVLAVNSREKYIGKLGTIEGRKTVSVVE